MKAQSLYGELAIDLLCGQVERSQPHTHATCYGRTFASAERNDRSLTSALGATDGSELQHIKKQFTCSSEMSRNTKPNPKQITGENLCTDLAADYHFAGLSKDCFRHQQATKSGYFQAGILASPEQENSAEYVKSVHDRFFQMQRRQGVKFCGRTGSVGESLSGKTRGCIRLMKFMISQTTTQRSYG